MSVMIMMSYVHVHTLNCLCYCNIVWQACMHGSSKGGTELDMQLELTWMHEYWNYIVHVKSDGHYFIYTVYSTHVAEPTTSELTIVGQARAFDAVI